MAKLNKEQIQQFLSTDIQYNNDSSGLIATDTQSAIDEVGSRLDTAESDISTNTNDISNLQNEVLTTADEGSGNGIDADLLDGMHLSDIDWGNVTMKDSDIGATQLSNSNDLNSLSDGWYSWTSSVPSNAPENQSYMVMVQINDGVQSIQMAFGTTSTGKIFIRRSDSGNFYAWTGFATSSNVSTNSSDISDLQNDKAEQTDLDTTNSNVSSNASDISDLQTNKADQTDLDTTNSNLSTHTGDADIHKKITSGTSAPSGGSDGDIYLQYE